MPRARRVDAPGYFHHVFNRGLRKRPIFERDRDYRVFLSLLGCAVRAQRIRLHAYCLMVNHYHLLVESVAGELSEVMQQIVGRYVSYFNRTRDLDGPLFRGRFRSIRVNCGAYLFVLLRYIDLNPVKARMCEFPWDYPRSSAAAHIRAGPRPRWLCRTLVDRFVRWPSAGHSGRLRAYAETFHGSDAGVGDLDLVDARIRHSTRLQDELDATLRAYADGESTALARWTMRADGTNPGLPMVDVRSIRSALSELGLECRAMRSWLEAALLRDLAGQGFTAVARIAEVSVSTARNRYEAHRRAVEHDAAYRKLIDDAARVALDQCFGPAGLRAAAVFSEYCLDRETTKSA